MSEDEFDKTHEPLARPQDYSSSDEEAQRYDGELPMDSIGASGALGATGAMGTQGSAGPLPRHAARQPLPQQSEIAAADTRAAENPEYAGYGDRYEEGARYVEAEPHYARPASQESYYDEAPRIEQQLDAEGNPIEVTRSRVQPNFVRQRTPHRTQEAIDDLAQDGASLGEYTHDSNISVRGGAFSGRSYRRARSGMGQVRGQGNRYSQYLEIPKGKRTIFVTQQRLKRRQSLMSTIGIIVLILAAVLIIWVLVSSL